MSPHAYRHVLAVAASLLVAGCRQDLPELTHETEHLKLGADFPLCRGQLDQYERVVTALEDELDTTVDKEIRVYVWNMVADVDEDPGWCDEGTSGCYINGKVFSELRSVEHELVHAVVDTFGSPSPFWSEGAAEALQTHRTRTGYSSPSIHVDKTGEDQINYATAGHFSRWLIETYGIEKYRQLLRSPSDGREAFESVYGLAFEDAEEDYLADAPHSYGAFLSCDDLPLVQLDDQTWSESIEIDCDEPSTVGSIKGLFSYRVVTVAEHGQYAFSTSASIVTIGRCPDDDYEEPPTLDDPELYGDIPAYTEVWVDGYRRALDGSGAVTTLNLAPGRYRLAVGFESFDARTANLEVAAVPPP